MNVQCLLANCVEHDWAQKGEPSVANTLCYVSKVRHSQSLSFKLTPSNDTKSVALGANFQRENLGWV